MTLAPIILFVYNRPCHTQKTIEALPIKSIHVIFLEKIEA